MILKYVAEKQPVFISYSRDDLEHAEILRGKLIAEGFDAFLDLADIVKGEPWRERLSNLICKADAVVFLISPSSVQSEICAWEIDEAEKWGKRVFPCICEVTPLDLIPGRLKRRNFTNLTQTASWESEFGELVASIAEDIEWVREQTRVTEQAAKWEAEGRPNSLLMRIGAIKTFEAMVLRAPANSIPNTETLIKFVEASKRKEKKDRRNRFILRAAAFLGLTAFIVIVQIMKFAGRPTVSTNYFDDLKPYAVSDFELRHTKSGAKLKDCGLMSYNCPDMLIVDLAECSQDNQTITINSTKRFAVSITEVTIENYGVCVAKDACKPVPATNFVRRETQFQGMNVFTDSPVFGISWNEAAEYANWMSNETGKEYRLISEMEWNSLVCQSSKSDQPELAKSNEVQGLGHARDSTANSFGVRGMHDGVSEWMADCSEQSDHATSAADCASKQRVVRGGSFEDEPYSRSPLRRYNFNESRRENSLGFRVVREVPPKN